MFVFTTTYYDYKHWHEMLHTTLQSKNTNNKCIKSTFYLISTLSPSTEIFTKHTKSSLHDKLSRNIKTRVGWWCLPRSFLFLKFYKLQHEWNGTWHRQFLSNIGRTVYFANWYPGKFIVGIYFTRVNIHTQVPDKRENVGFCFEEYMLREEDQVVRRLIANKDVP
jgi:hypothetical protein